MACWYFRLLSTRIQAYFCVKLYGGGGGGAENRALFCSSGTINVGCRYNAA